ncbi:Glycine receptor subunit alpha-3 [Daphnia magna]|uniref:Glycine receptor subunit alpha-3 n=1 Tax=Daphnia magna TaxID=35525 RepID=A0A164SRE0_9CRUS|nr:Glycine receptor subunit alpha-3 [Daphnia magna]
MALYVTLVILSNLAGYGIMVAAMELSDILPDRFNYDKMRPPRLEGQPAKVFNHLTVMGLDSINENSMTYMADVFYVQSWSDHRLSLPENMTSEYRLLDVEWLKSIWRPDSYFKNAKQVTFQTMTIPNHYLWLYRDKKILYVVKLTLTLSCSMNFALYPHDSQECKIQIESLSHTTDDLIFEWDETGPLDVWKTIELPQLQLEGNYTNDCTQVYATGNFTCLEVVFVLKRRLGYYMFHTYIPTCLIVVMSENARMLMGQPPRPPGPTPAQRARIRAIQVDRFSRFFFPIPVYCPKWLLLGCFCILSLELIKRHHWNEALVP